jgi:hypothetical protein
LGFLKLAEAVVFLIFHHQVCALIKDLIAEKERK